MSSSAIVAAAAVTCAVLGTATGVWLLLPPQSAIAQAERVAPAVSEIPPAPEVREMPPIPVSREIPPAQIEDDVQRGHRLYRQMCAKCHGPNMVNSGIASFDLRKFPENDPNRFITSVTKGKGNMPAHGDILHPSEVQALWAYVKTRGKA